MFPTDVVIVAGARTPMTRYTGAFKDVSAIDLCARAAKEAIRRSGADPAEFDHVIIDSPPVLVVSDAVRLSVGADSVILVVRSGYTPQDAFARAQEVLMQVNAAVMGVVLNAADLASPELSYYSQYGYYSSSSQLRKD